MFATASKPLEWMASYLSGSYQTGTTDGNLSEPVQMSFRVPQESVLGPKFYTMYTSSVGAICKMHRLEHHFYAEDSELYLSFKPTDQVTRAEAIHRVEACLEDILSWMQGNILKQNAYKTEIIVSASERNAGLVNDISVAVGDSNIRPASYFINKSFVNSLVTSTLDYCNALWSGVPNTILNKLQSVQNTAARVVYSTSRYCHITYILKELHWLPVQYRVQYKILTHMCKELSNQSPVYIKELLHVCKSCRESRSQNSSLILKLPRSHTVSYGDRSFAIIAPKLWTALPPGFRECNKLFAFKKSLKTHFFMQMHGQL